jgi:glycosyltransferase involved in cell wall biosynthesis
VPEVTAVIPTRNRREILARTLRTVAWQEGVDWEAVVIDDGSTDGTADAVRTMGDHRISLHRHDRPVGVTAARNTGISVARGQWVAFLDDDDLWAPDKLAAQLAAVRRTGRHWVYGGQVLIDAHDRVIAGGPPPDPERVVDELRRWNPVPAGSSNVVARKPVLHEVGGFDASLTAVGDWDLWLRLASVGLPACVSEPLVAYRQHPGQASLRMIRDLDQVRELERRHDMTIDWPVMLRWAGWVALLDGRRTLALRLYARAARWGGRPWMTDAAWADFALLRHEVKKALRQRIRHPRQRWSDIAPRPPASDNAWGGAAQLWLDQLDGADTSPAIPQAP